MDKAARIVALKQAFNILKSAMEYEDPILSMDMEVLHDFNALDNPLEFMVEMRSIIGKFENSIKILENPDNFNIGPDDVRLDV